MVIKKRLSVHKGVRKKKTVTSVVQFLTGNAASFNKPHTRLSLSWNYGVVSKKAEFTVR